LRNNLAKHFGKKLFQNSQLMFSPIFRDDL